MWLFLKKCQHQSFLYIDIRFDNVYKILKFKPQSFHFLKIVALYLAGDFLASHYRLIQNELKFLDFGLADSGSVSIIAIYLIFTLLKKIDFNLIKFFFGFIYLHNSRNILPLFPGFVGTFDFKDLIYFLVGFILIYLFDFNKRDKY